MRSLLGAETIVGVARSTAPKRPDQYVRAAAPQSQRQGECEHARWFVDRRHADGICSNVSSKQVN